MTQSKTTYNNQREAELSSENIGRLLWRYSLPAIVGTMVNSLYNIVDRIYLGQGVGPMAISGLALTFPFIVVLMAFGMLVGVGAAARISIFLGEGNHQQGEKVLGNAFTLTFLLTGSVIAVSLYFMTDILMLFGGTEQTVAYAITYMRIIIPSSILSALSFGFNNIMRASGYPKKAMWTMIISAVTNIILDPIFIFGLDMGIAGAAWATTISYGVGTIWVLWHFTRRNTNLRFHRKNFRLEPNIIKSILNIGMSPFSIQLATSLIVVITNYSLLKYGGDIALGAFGIQNSISILIIMVVVGLNQGVQPIIGFNYGAKQYERMFHAVRLAALIATMMTTAGFLAAMLIPRSLVSLFSTDDALLAVAANGLRISLIAFPLVGAQIVVTTFLQSIGKAKISIFLSLTRQVIFFTPCLLLIPPYWGLNGVWASMPVSELFSAIVTAITLYIFVRKFKLEQQNELQQLSTRNDKKNR